VRPTPPCGYGKTLSIYNKKGKLVDYLWVEYKGDDKKLFHVPEWVGWDIKKQKLFAIKSLHCTNFPLEGRAFTEKRKAKEYCKKFKCCEVVEINVP
jgi:hypothetical protein